MASSSRSCLRIHSNVARAASFSFSRAANLRRTSPGIGSEEGASVLRGGLEAALRVGNGQTLVIQMHRDHRGGSRSRYEYLFRSSLCPDLPTGGEGTDRPLPTLPILSAQHTDQSSTPTSALFHGSLRSTSPNATLG